MAGTYTVQEIEDYIVSRITKFYNIAETGISLWVNDEINFNRWEVGLLINGSPVPSIPSWSVSYVKVKDKKVCNLAEMSAKIDRLLSRLSGFVCDSLREMLDLDCKTLRPDTELLIGVSQPWKTELTTMPLLHIFFDIKIGKHSTKTHRVVTYTDRYSGEEILGYFKETKAGYTRCDNNQFEFSEIRGESGIKLSLQEMGQVDNSVQLELETGVLRLPRRGRNRRLFTCWNVVEQSDKKIVVDLIKVASDISPLFKEQIRYTASLGEDGEPKLAEEKIELDWVEQIYDYMDTFRNPINRDIHPHLEPDELPAYEGKNVWIISIPRLDLELVYVKLHGDVWAPVVGGLDWIRAHKHIVPQIAAEVERYRLSEQLQK